MRALPCSLSARKDENLVINPSDPSRAEPEPSDVVWLFKVDGGATVRWDWSNGCPPLRQLLPHRSPKARAFAKNAPALVFSYTVADHLLVESGLERELVEELDGDPGVSWLVAQPLELHFLSDGRRVQRHIPDLLGLAGDRVTVWDARPRERQDAAFQRLATWTDSACSEVGWKYQVFAGHQPVRRVNGLWLAAYRHAPVCIEAYADVIRQGIEDGTIRGVGDVAARDRGYGQLIAAMYHLLWARRLACDLDQPITPSTSLSWAGK